MIQINESSAASTSPSEADSTTDAITHILRQGARKMLAAAIEDEVNEFLDTRQHLRDEHGHRLVIRNGFLPERELLTGLGPATLGLICLPLTTMSNRTD